MMTTIRANADMQRWVDDAALYPRAVPARLRMLLDAGLTEAGGGTYLATPSSALLERMPAAELEPFANQVSLDSLKPAQRLSKGSDAWAYECVAMGLAFGELVLALTDGFVSIVLDLDEERSSCVLRFTRSPWEPAHPDEVAWLVMAHA